MYSGGGVFPSWGPNTYATNSNCNADLCAAGENDLPVRTEGNLSHPFNPRHEYDDCDERYEGPYWEVA